MDSDQGGDQEQEEQPRCGFWIPSMDHPCQRQVSEPHHVCHMHPPDDLDELPRCGFEKDDGDYCRRQRSRGEAGTFCHLHPPEEADLPETRGAPEGNDFAVGNPGGGPPEGNLNAMKHGLYAKASRVSETFEGDARQEFIATYAKFKDMCMTEDQALKLAVYDTMETNLIIRMIEDDHEHTIYLDDGTPVEVFADDIVSAMQSYRREIRLGLHYEGVSAQHTGGGGAGHDNLGVLVESESD